jgi:GT2 family glycosyltransferase
MVASRMINFFDRQHMDNAGHFVLNTGEILPLGHDDPVTEHDRARTNAGACAGAALYRVELFRQLGLFDTFFRTGYEDAEFGLRALLCGYDCRYAPEAIVYHKISRSINKIRDFQYTLKIQVDVFYTVLKCWPTVNLIINAPFFFFKIGTITIMNLVFGRWKFMRVLWTALYVVLIKDRTTITRSRGTFFAKAKPSFSWYAFQQKLTFFLWFDIRRFYKYVWKREKMVFERF